MNLSQPLKETSSMPFSCERTGDLMDRTHPTAQDKLPVDDVVKLQKAPKIVAEQMAAKKKRRKKKWKKPKDKPNRPLSAYNLFFQSERAIMLGDDAPSIEDEIIKKRVHCKTHGKIGFAEMARAIGNKWKTLDAESKKLYEMQASKEKQRYAIELANWKEAQKTKCTDEEQKQTLDGEITQTIVGNPIDSDALLSNASQALKPSDSLMFMMADERRRRNLSLLNHGSQDISLEYLRALQEQRQMDQTNAAFLGRSPLDAAPLIEYPSAAEASANAILQQFQHILPKHQPVSAQQPQQQMLQSNARDLGCFQTLTRYTPNMAAAAAMRRFQHHYNTNEFNLNGLENPLNSVR